MNSDRVNLIVDSIQYDLGFIQGREDLGYPISKLEYFSPKPHNSNIIATAFPALNYCKVIFTPTSSGNWVWLSLVFVGWALDKLTDLMLGNWWLKITARGSLDYIFLVITLHMHFPGGKKVPEVNIYAQLYIATTPPVCSELWLLECAVPIVLSMC